MAFGFAPRILPPGWAAFAVAWLAVAWLAVAWLAAATAAWPAASATDEKAPVPDAALQEQALATVREVFKKEYDAAKDASQRQALAKRMLDEALATHDDPTARFVLLRVARDIATQAGDGLTAFEAVDQMDAAYQIDAVSMKAEILTQGARMARAQAEHRSVTEQAADLMQEAIRRDEFAVARQLGDLAASEARKASDLKIVQWVRDRLLELDQIAEASAEAEKAEATLAEKPTDPEANSVVGRYECLLKGDWDTGISMLALGSDAKLKAAAAVELQGASTASEKAALGDQWMKVAEGLDGIAKRQATLRAAHWYREAAPNLGGLDKARVERTLVDLDAIPADWRRVVSWGLAFDGKDDYVEIPSWQYDGKTPITVEATVVPAITPPVPQYMHVVSDFSGGGMGLRFAQGYWEFAVHAGKQFAVAKSDGPAFPNRLVHLAGVYDGRMLRLYVGGRLQSTIVPTAAPFTPSPRPYLVGACPDGRGGAELCFSGIIREVRISNVARYDRSFRVSGPLEPDADTILLLRLGEGQGDVARDSSGNGHHGTIYGAQWVRMPGP